MSLTTPYTRLEAVNEMLMGIGQAPVNSLTGIPGDPLIAQQELDKVVRYVLLWGFAFNTDDAYVLTPDINGRLLIPAGVLRITPSDRKLRLVQRANPDGNQAIYDAANQTFVFPQPDGQQIKPYTFKVVWGFDFESLPETAKNFIAVSATRRFQRRVIGSAELDQYNNEDEQKAWSLLQREERNAKDSNQFRQSPSMTRWFDREGSTASPIGYTPGGEVTD